MAKILINDGIHPTGLKMLQDAGFEVNTNNIPNEELPSKLQEYAAICVRSATKVRKDLIDVCPDLKFIGRGGVGMDNIDVDYARSKGIAVCNTPAASSRSVAELAFGHLLSINRFLYKSNQAMPSKGNAEFKTLKKAYSKGQEIEGKTIGIIGFGRIGQEAAKMALGLQMKVMAVDPNRKNANLTINIHDQSVNVNIKTVPMDEMLAHADAITLHIPFTGKPALGADEFNKMKDGVIIINAARGGTIDEDALLEALNSGKVSAAGLDVFTDEPKPRADILNHENVSCTPHTGASTAQAQEKIGIELAEQLIEHLS
jgi:D-3-phosphoglycerate dehydrogenase